MQQCEPINYANVKYTFTCVRKHLFRDKMYHVHALPDMITIGEQFNDPNPKYRIELKLTNTLYWKIENGQNRAFGMKYNKSVKYFEATPELLAKFRATVACSISFFALDDHYKIEEQIGKGSFSSVYKISRNHDKKEFAMKYVSSKQKNDKENMQLLENEIGILHQLNSPQIIKIYEVYRVEEFHYGIVIEFVDGLCLATAIDQLKKNTAKYKEQDIKIIMQQLLKALAYIHSEEVIHRDIKPQNIMLINNRIKVIDFGLSIKNSTQFNRCGTPGYMAPEIVNMKKDQQKPWTHLCDVFSLGVVFFKLLSKGHGCFQGQTSEQVLASNKRCQIDWTLVQQYNYHKNTIQLLKDMLAKEPEERVSAYDALGYAFFSDLPPIRSMEIAANSMTLKSKYVQATTNLEIRAHNDSFQNVDSSIIEKHEIYVYKSLPSIMSRQK